MAIRCSRIGHEVFPGTSTVHQLVCLWLEVLLVQSPRADHGHGPQIMGRFCPEIQVLDEIVKECSCILA